MMHLRVFLSCRENELTIWFSQATDAIHAEPIEGLPKAVLLHEDGILKAVRFLDLTILCPYDLAKVARARIGVDTDAELLATYDPACDMGYVHLERRGPASVAHTICTSSGINVDIGKDGALIGLEIFSPSVRLPELVSSSRN